MKIQGLRKKREGGGGIYRWHHANVVYVKYLQVVFGGFFMIYRCIVIISGFRAGSNFLILKLDYHCHVFICYLPIKNNIQSINNFSAQGFYCVHHVKAQKKIIFQTLHAWLLIQTCMINHSKFDYLINLMTALSRTLHNLSLISKNLIFH